MNPLQILLAVQAVAPAAQALIENLRASTSVDPMRDELTAVRLELAEVELARDAANENARELTRTLQRVLTAHETMTEALFGVGSG